MILDPGRGGARRDRLRRRAARDPGAARVRARRRLHLPGRGVSARRLHPRPRDAAAAACVHQPFRPPHLCRSAAGRYSRRRAGLTAAAAAVAYPEARGALGWPPGGAGAVRPARDRPLALRRAHLCVAGRALHPHRSSRGCGARSSPRSNGKPPSMRRSDRSPPGRRRPRSPGSRQAAATFLRHISLPGTPVDPAKQRFHIV